MLLYNTTKRSTENRIEKLDHCATEKLIAQ
jgi:hypothetical protein